MSICVEMAISKERGKRPWSFRVYPVLNRWPIDRNQSTRCRCSGSTRIMRAIRRTTLLLAITAVLGCTGATNDDDGRPTAGDVPEAQGQQVEATPFALSDAEIVTATEKLVTALDEGRVSDVLALLDLSDGRVENFNDCDFSTNDYFRSNDIEEVRERLMWMHEQGTSFSLEDVQVGSGADPDEDVPSVAGASVARFGPGLPEQGHRGGWKLTISVLDSGGGLFGQLPMTSPEICANPDMRL